MNRTYMPGIIAAAIVTLLTSCSKTTDTGFNNTIKAPLQIEFDNIVGGKNLQLNTGTYFTATGDTFSVSLLQYFISNIKLTRADGTEYIVPQDSSYFLIKEADPARRVANLTVPEGEYTKISFLLGVDSIRSTMDISRRKGVLEPSGGMEDGMYWGWNSGYIFFKMEGISPQAPIDPTGNRKFRYHIGGFGGYSAPTINNIKTISIDLAAGGTAKVKAGRTSNIHLMVDISKMFTGTADVSIASHPTVMFSAYSVNIANNFNGMFRHDHTEN